MNNSQWFKDAIIYHILIDRFAGYDKMKDWRRPQFLGGNLKGIIHNIQYLVNLGINTIWLSPFYKTNRYHGYSITDYYKIDPSFGTLEDLKKLISKAERENIRIIADFVPNHCSNEHPFFKDARKDKSSEYKKWFLFKKWPDNYLCFLNHKNLPKLNLQNKDVFNHIAGAAKYWLDKGIKGFRLDHVIGPRHSFWKKFSKEIKNFYPDTVLIGEALLDGIDYKLLNTIGIPNKYLKWFFNQLTQEKVQKEYINILDGVLDFYFRNRIIEYIAWKENSGEYTDILNLKLKNHYNRYPTDFYLSSFIDNHDMSRFLFECGSKDKLKEVLKLQFSLPQPPVIYYGTETGLVSEDPVTLYLPNSDLNARQTMPWHKIDDDLFEFCRNLIYQRKKQEKNTK